MYSFYNDFDYVDNGEDNVEGGGYRNNDRYNRDGVGDESRYYGDATINIDGNGDGDDGDGDGMNVREEDGGGLTFGFQSNIYNNILSLGDFWTT